MKKSTSKKSGGQFTVIAKDELKPHTVTDATGDRTKPPKPKADKAKSSKRLSGLDAAAHVLAKSKQPLSCGDLTSKILELGLWKTDGKTPAATIHSAIVREIKDKGASARFKKVGRGLFATGKSTR